MERVQKSFFQIALGSEYSKYEDALAQTGMYTLENRRTKLCLSFGKKAAKHPKHSHWFEEKSYEKLPNTRSVKQKYNETICRLERFKNSPIPYLTILLNEN